MSALASLLSGAATAPAPAAVDAPVAPGLPGDIASALFIVTPPFQQLLADAAGAALGAADAPAGNEAGNLATGCAGDRAALLALLPDAAQRAADATAAAAAAAPIQSDNATTHARSARHRREAQQLIDDPVAVQILAALAPPPTTSTDAAIATDVAAATTNAIDASGARDSDIRSIGERAVRAMETTLQQAARAALAAEDGADARREPGTERRSSPIANLASASASTTDGAASAAAATHAMARSFAATSTVERSVAVPIGNPQWAQAMAAEVRWCADNGVQAATVRLSPEHLGPVEVRVDVRDSQINVTFGASHADTRAALEQALPKLREMFAGAGLSLGQASVQQEMRRESQNHSPSLRGLGREDEIAAVSGHVVGLGLVDEYA